jgi:polyisoprenoid-binding protein YceI
MILPILLCLQVAPNLVSERFDADPQHSSVAFVVRLFGVAKVPGRFRDYAATIVYDTAHLEQSSVTAVIETASISTDMDFRDNHLRSPDFFNATTYPTIVFSSDRIERTPAGLRAVGRLTMHGVTRVMALPFAVILPPGDRSRTGTITMGVEIHTRLNRKDFGIAGTNKFNPDFNPLVPLPDSVDIEIELLANQPGYLNRTFAGQTPPSIADTVSKMIAARGAAAAVRLYRQLRAADTTVYDFGPGQLNALGRQLLQRGQTSDAIEILRLNEETYPLQDGAATSLGDAYMLIGDSIRAVAAYRRELVVDSLDPTATEMLRHLQPRGR